MVYIVHYGYNIQTGYQLSLQIKKNFFNLQDIYHEFSRQISNFWLTGVFETMLLGKLLQYGSFKTPLGGGLEQIYV